MTVTHVRRLRQRFPFQRVWISVACLAALALLAGPTALRAQAAATPPVSLAQFQNFIFLWASGTPAIEQIAQQTCAQEQLTLASCQAISADVRATWVQFIEQDPAAVGRLHVAPQMNERQRLLTTLTRQLAQLMGTRLASFLAVSDQTGMVIRSAAFLAGAQPVKVAGQHLMTVWATSFKQVSGLPARYKATTSAYVALPDAYLKYANLGDLSTSFIPAIYQPFYVPTGKTSHWTVAITANNKSVSGALVTDVGPWNEDDNWWDPDGTSTTLPANCPVSPTLLAADATSNPLVDGICPNTTSMSSTPVNLRRLYYYLLYQHYGLPFFQPAGYAPTGSFSDGQFPTTLSQYCAEPAAASTASNGITCGPGLDGYNNHAGGWLRNSTHDAPILNQSSIDLSPAIDKALGWVYPSSGLVSVDVGTLP